MKKLMIAAAIVCVAVMSQGATVTWQSSTLKDYTGANVTSAGVISGYLFELTASEYATYSVLDAATLSTTLYADFKDQFASADASGANTYKKGASALDLTGPTDFTAPATAYAAVIYMDDANNMVMGNVAYVAIESSQNVKVGQLANNLGGTGAATSWQSTATPGPEPIPEPTSGLLVLLGVAGLALRRRHV